MFNAKKRLALSILILLAESPTANAGRILTDNLTGTTDTKLSNQLNQTQVNVANLISDVCGARTNLADFQTRCDRFINFADTLRQQNDGQLWRPGYAKALQQVSPEQFISQGTVATRSVGNIIGSRLAALRMGARGFNVAGLNQRGDYMGIADRFLSPGTGGGAGDDNAPIWNRLGLFFNGLGSFGDVDTSTNQLGFDFRSAGLTAGGDYRFSESLIIGAAFTYLRMESDFSRNQGSLNSDSYTGSIYGTYYLPDGFYVDALGSIGGLNYDSTRSINYILQDQLNGTIFDDVSSSATASPDGRQYVASLGLGFNRAFGSINVNPYVRGNYNRLEVGGFSEQGGAGLAVALGDQQVESVTSVVGLQLSNAISTAKGVVTPYFHGEWRHEYQDDARIIPVKFLGNTSSPNLAFSTVTESPDRNYFNVGVGLSATFGHGISAFANYDALLGYRNITSHALTMGTRFEF